MTAIEAVLQRNKNTRIIGGLLMLLTLLLVVLAFIPAPPQGYYKHVDIAETALTGGRVLVSDLNNVQDMIKHDGQFKEALLVSGFTEEQIRRLVGEEFMYVQVKP